jgi:peptide/nickel transport system permease protein
MPTEPVVLPETAALAGISDVAGAVAVADEPGGRRRRGRITIGVWLAIGWLVLITVLALAAPWLPIRPYDEPDFGSSQLPPFQDWTASNVLGTDKLGRSMLSRVIYGARVSLAVGFLSVGIGMVVGTLLGMIAGYFKGRSDRVLSVFADATIAFPPLVLLLAMVTILDRNLKNIVIGLAILIVPAFFRLARATAIVVAERDFVAAAFVLGAKRSRIVFREILPTVIVSLLAYAPILIGLVIVAEGALAFLGLSLPPPTPSWGGMIKEGSSELEDALYLTLVPGTAMVLTVLSCNWIGRHLQAYYDPKGPR